MCTNGLVGSSSILSLSAQPSDPKELGNVKIEGKKIEKKEDESWSAKQAHKSHSAKFSKLLKNAKQIGIYEPRNYKKKNITYCGMKITDNPYFDYKK